MSDPSSQKSIQPAPAPSAAAQNTGFSTAGFCSATCVDKESLRKEISNPQKTSDVFATCDLPKRFDYPHWFNGYGCQVNSQHPFYRTSASVYGWYPPGIHSVSSVFFPLDYSMSDQILRHGMHSVPTEYYPTQHKFTDQLAAAGMYRNYSLNTAKDRHIF